MAETGQHAMPHEAAGETPRRPTPPPDYRKYLDPQVLARISGLQLRARLAVAGLYAGMHRSPYRGVSVEFADHRPYTQSDDIRHIDWRLFGRTDRYFVKEYQQDTNLNCILAVDCSESMAYRSDAAPLSKHEYATAVAASLAYLALTQRDSVGLALFDRRITRFRKPSNHPSLWRPLIDDLQVSIGPARTSLRAVLDDLAERVSRSVVVLISDLFDDPLETLRGLQHLRYRGNDVIVFNVWDPAELTFPFRGPTRFEGLEALGRLLVEPRALRRRYQAQTEAFRATLERGCRAMQADYVVCDTSAPLGPALSAYLATRGVRARTHSSRTRGGG